MLFNIVHYFYYYEWTKLSEISNWIGFECTLCRTILNLCV